MINIINCYRIISTVLGLFILSVQDYQKGEIELKYLLLLCDKRYLYGYLILFMCLAFYKHYFSYIGGADIFVMCLLISRYGFYYVNQVLLYASLLGIVFYVLKRDKKIRFIPFISGGVLLRGMLL